MITVNIRKQGGAAIMTIPSDVLKLLNMEVGTTLMVDVTKGAFIARPLAAKKGYKRYTLTELLRGATVESMTTLHAETIWARDGESIGRELS